MVLQKADPRMVPRWRALQNIHGPLFGDSYSLLREQVGNQPTSELSH